MATEWVEVESSNIASIGYVSETNGLLVRFKSGNTYTYSDVPKDIYDEFVNSKSKGKYFAEHIKEVFEYHKAG